MKFKSILKIFFFCLFFGFLIFLINNYQKVYALDFTHEIKAYYEIKENGQAFVNYEVETTNRVSNNYLQLFELKLPFEPEGLSVSESPTKIQIKELNRSSILDKYKLVIEFINPVIGVNKKFKWRVSFTIKDIVIKHGIQKAIIIPTFSDNNPSINFNIIVKYPKKIGGIQYIYGNASIEDNQEYLYYSFVKKDNLGSSILFLIGEEIEYEFIVKDIPDKTEIVLPSSTDYQKIHYKNFTPKNERIFNDRDIIFVNAVYEDRINSIIKTYKGYEKQHYPTYNLYKKYEYLDDLVTEVRSKYDTNYEIAKYIYIDLLKKFKVSDYSFNENTTNQLIEGKYEVNIAELNYIYRYLLNKFGIDSRGVFGYVFPVQPLKRDSYNTYQHIWTEFWDGEKWIIVDPAWYLSSGGTIYFDNNNFHHIKFGSYYNEDELASFIKQRKYTTVTPLNYVSNVNNYSKDFDISISDSINLNRELTIEFKNPTNQFLKFSIVDIVSEDAIIAPRLNTLPEKIIAPGSSLKYSIPLEYGLILFNQNIRLNISIKINFFENQSFTKFYRVMTILRSNISSYISAVFAYAFIIFSFLTIGVLTVYKRRTINL